MIKNLDFIKKIVTLSILTLLVLPTNIFPTAHPYIGTQIVSAQEGGEEEDLEAMDETGGEPITQGDIQAKCLDGSYSKILGDVIQTGLNSIFDELGFGLGEDVTTENKSLSWQNLGQQLEACTRDLIQNSSKVMLQNLQKRLLDQLTNQTIAWLNDEQEPRFVSDFWSFTKEATDAAAGDLIRELDLAELYPDDNMKNYLVSVITERARENTNNRFSKIISSNLEEEVGDVEAFKEDFTEGGFTGLITASDPKNNPMGAAFLTGQYLESKESEKIAEQSKNVTSDGYKSDIACVAWVLVKKDGTKPAGIGGAYIDPATGREKTKRFDPEKAPPVSEPPAEEVINGVTYKYNCTKTIVKTPSGTVQNITETAITSQFSYLLSAKDVNSYVSKIASAAVNRLMRDGIAFFGSSEGNNSEYLPSGFEQKQNEYNENSSGEGVQNQSKLVVRDDLIRRANKLITDSSSILGSVSTTESIIWFETRINFMDQSLFSTSSAPMGLLTCMQIKPSFVPTNYPVGCSLLIPLPSGNCTLRFTGKTLQTLQTELRSLVNQKRGANTARKNEAQGVLSGMNEKIIEIRNISESTPIASINRLRTDVRNAENTLNKTRNDFTTLKAETNPIIDHIDQNRRACTGPEIFF